MEARGGRLRVEARALGGYHLEVAEVASRHRSVRVYQELETLLDTGAGLDHTAVDAAHALAVGPREVDNHAVARHGNGHLDVDRVLGDAVVVEVAISHVDTVRDLLDRGAILGLGLIEHQLDGLLYLVPTETAHDRAEPLDSGPAGTDLGHQVTHQRGREPGIERDQIHDLLVEAAGPENARWSDSQTLLEDVHRVTDVACFLGADIVPVRLGSRESSQYTVDEDRGEHGHVVEVATGDARVVDYPNIPFPESLVSLDLDDGSKGSAQATQEEGEARELGRAGGRPRRKSPPSSPSSRR